MERFYVGAPELNFVTMQDEVPNGLAFFMSHRRLSRRSRCSSFPKARHSWALDSGTFGYCNNTEQLPTPEEYVAAVRRYDTEIGNMEWAAQQDLMCEPWMLAKTGRTVKQNQRDTITNYQRLVELWWDAEDREHAARVGLDDYHSGSLRDDLNLCPIKPSLQGWEPWEYRRHVDMWCDAGINLHEVNIVGLGSVCRRAATKPIRKLIEELSGFLDLHGFGLKADAVAMYGPVLLSSDSMAWSEGTRHQVERWYCPHGRVKWERNCPIHAIQWGARILDSGGDNVHWEDRWTGVPDYSAVEMLELLALWTPATTATNGRVTQPLASACVEGTHVG